MSCILEFRLSAKIDVNPFAYPVVLRREKSKGEKKKDVIEP